MRRKKRRWSSSERDGGGVADSAEKEKEKEKDEDDNPGPSSKALRGGAGGGGGMDALLQEGAPVVEQIATNPTLALQRMAEQRQRHVDGEFADEDGDTATEFINADPVPNSFGESSTHKLAKAHKKSSQEQNRSNAYEQSEFSRRKRDTVKVGLESWDYERVMVISDDEDEDGYGHGDGASVFCERCGEAMGLGSIFQMLTCACLFCRRCLRLHAETFLYNAAEFAGKESTNMGLDAVMEVVGTSDDGSGGRRNGKVFGMADSSSRLMKSKGGVEEPVVESISCPKAECSGRFPLSSSQLLAPEAFRKWEEAANEAFFKKNSAFVRCPGCTTVFEKVMGVIPPGVALTGVPELDRTAPFIELDNEGRQLSRLAMCHKATNRFRCRVCTNDFCGACMELPYHLGKTCEEVAEEKNAARCLYCEVPLRASRRWVDDKDLYLRSVKDLQNQLNREGVDAAWCVEKGDLVAVQRFVAGICEAKDCRKRASLSCTRNLECGHHCGGVRGERLCLPCLEEECQQNAAARLGRHFLPVATDLCGICLVEPLQRAPSIQLRCGHVVHMHCAKQKLAQGFPGPGISFGYLNCPQCPQPMQHVGLDADLRKHLMLMSLVEDKALKRLTMEGLLRSAKEIQPGGGFEGRPTAYALQLYQYYVCSKCNAPYCGGKRDCMRNERNEANEAHNPADLVCGACSAAGGGSSLCKKGHGKEYIEFKCRFCCSPATYFCFGRTHFCDSCHISRPDMQKDIVLNQCRGPKWCPLRIPHLPNGEECCLGCSMCRFDSQ